MPSPTQPPDDASGQRYSKAFPYTFVVYRTPSDITIGASATSGSVGNPVFITEGSVDLILPQQISLREPFATVVTVMQDAGKVIETRGQVLKLGSISGTTGFLPPLPAGQIRPPSILPLVGQLISNTADLDATLGRLSGYLAFMKLRYLFRMYGDLRKRGALDVQMHFFDYKNDDFWRVEPESFDMQRSSRRPMSYDYNIAFKCIEYSDQAATNDQDPLTGPGLKANTGILEDEEGLVFTSGEKRAWHNPGVLSTTSRLSDMTNSALTFIANCDAVTQKGFQLAINKVNGLVGILQAANDASFTQLNNAISFLVDASAEIDFLSETAEELAPDNIKQEINEWYLEARKLIDNLGIQLDNFAGSQPQQDVVDTDQRFSLGRMKQGATTDLMPAIGSSPDANPFIGSSGLSLVTDANLLANGNQYTTVIINTGEDIYAVARRVLGSIQRFIDLVLINQLEFPFIVADTSRKPPNTLAWGEHILIPTAVSDTTSTTINDGVNTAVVPTTAGTVTTASLPSQLIDLGQEWLPDQWVGYSVTATTGGSSQTLIANGNTDTQLTLNGNWTITITPGTTTYSVTYNTFSPRRPVTPDARAYGIGLLVVFGSDGRGDLAVGASSSLAVVSGLDNLIQAITLRARCPVGLHPFHPNYGMPAPVGRPATDNVFVLYTFFIRRSLLSDPRISKVRNVQFILDGDKLMLNAEVQPVASRLARPISVQVGS